MGDAVSALRPLVVEVGPGAFAWIQSGRGWLLRPESRTWAPLTDAPGIGGRVLGVTATAALVEIFGSPVTQ